MSRPNRRRFLLTAAALGLTPAWTSRAAPSATGWTERRERYPQGVASGDPAPDSVILWTRYPARGAAATLTCEVAEDEAFQRVVATTKTEARAAMGWTTRVM